MSMNTQRLSVSIPRYLYDQLVTIVSTRQVSKFITQALEKYLLEEQEKVELDPINQFISLRKKLPKVSRQTILRAIKKGRQ